MGFKQGAFATVWEVEPKSDRWTKIRVSISRKNKDTDEYEEEFSGFIDCIGSTCAPKAAKLQRRDRIKLGNVDVTTQYNKERGVTYTNFKMTSFDRADDDGNPNQSANGGRSAHPSPAAAYEGENEQEEDYPF